MLRTRDHRTVGYSLAFVLAVAAASLGLASAAFAQADECLVEIQQESSGGLSDGATLCGDADANKTCTFSLGLCLNQSQTGCTAGAIKGKKVKLKTKGKGCKSKVFVAPSGTTSVCGAFTGVTVKTKKKGTVARSCTVRVKVKTKGKPKRSDTDTATLTCNPPSSPCPTTTTSTTTTPTTATTSTTAAVCGNGQIEVGEVCDPPCQAGGQCTGGQVCRNDCAGCVTPAPCGATCGATTPTQLRFTTVSPNIGTRQCQGGTKDGNACTSNEDCPQGGCSSCPTNDGTVTGMMQDASGDPVCNLRSGGLYFGGSGDAVPLPAVVPDLGTSLLKVACCAQNGTTMQLVGTSDTEAGGSSRKCTSGTVINPEYPTACQGGPNAGNLCTTDADCPPPPAGGVAKCFAHPGCLFGPPLPIPNPGLGVSLSTCVINRVARNAAGTAECDTGSSAVSLPLVSDLYLTGDLLDNSAPDRPGILGIQPCPLCTGPSGSETCKGGPRHGMSCTPGSTGLGGQAAYPTSHDCPPPRAAFIGPLDIPFALTTGMSQKTSTDMPSVGTDRTFCGFCGGGVAFKSPPVPCTSNADCVGLVGCGSDTGSCSTCKQRQAGAFQVGDARTITLTGIPAGPLTDHLTHDSTLVSVFCIPPSFNGAVDGTADLPGPGAVTLPGETQLMP